MPSVSTGMSAFFVIFIVVAAIVVAGIVVTVVVIVRNGRRVRRAGHNPFTVQADLATRLLDSRALAADRPVGERLQKLDALRATGAISDGEHSQARAEVLRAG